MMLKEFTQAMPSTVTYKYFTTVQALSRSEPTQSNWVGLPTLTEEFDQQSCALFLSL
jgi:hypothetical protein